MSIKSLLLYESHDTDVSGHTGMNKTAQLLRRQFDWPHLYRDVSKYVSTCVACQSNKANNQRPIGLLQPLPIPGAAMGGRYYGFNHALTGHSNRT